MQPLRNEQAHKINGVPGRLMPLHVPPAPWVDGVFANQTWVSESRPAVGGAHGYEKGSTIQVDIRFDDNCRNGHMTFSITGTVYDKRGRHDAGGCIHDDIAQFFPELAPLIKWHLMSTDSPMHYVANTVYHADAHGPNRAWVYFNGPNDPLNLGESKERLLSYAKTDEALKAEGQPGYRVQWDEKTAKVANLDHARSSACWPDAPEALLTGDPEALKDALLQRLPGLLASFESDMRACGFEYVAPARIVKG